MIPLRSRILPIRNAKHWKILLHSICYGNGKDTKGVEGMAENKPMDIVEKPTKNETVCEKSRGDRARELFREGYNCSQAVTLAFAEELEARGILQQKRDERRLRSGAYRVENLRDTGRTPGR